MSLGRRNPYLLYACMRAYARASARELSKEEGKISKRRKREKKEEKKKKNFPSSLEGTNRAISFYKKLKDM